MRSENPYITFVATSRNDGHGGNIKKRMHLFVRGLIEQCNRHKLPCELILVEWNPPADQSLLKDVLPLPGKDDLLTVRFIQVPESIHKSYVRSATIPLFQMIAKNAGIRRARGEWICATNVDLIFSDELFAELAKRNLKPKSYYRASRWDIRDGVEMDWGLDRLLLFARMPVNRLRILGRSPIFPHINNFNFYQTKGWHIRPFWFDLKEYVRLKISSHSPEEFKIRMLDLNACGDFTLMHRDAWQDIRGYLELDLYSIHVDSMAILQAASLGYEQHVFPVEACAFHIDHPLGWEAMDALQKLRFWEERPGIGFDIVWGSAMQLLKTPTRIDLNSENWGYADRELEEQTFPNQN